MTPLNDPAQTTWVLESRALSSAGVRDTAERELRAIRSTCGTPHDALLLALRYRNQSGTDRAHGTHERDCGTPLEAML